MKGYTSLAAAIKDGWAIKERRSYGYRMIQRIGFDTFETDVILKANLTEAA